MGLPAHRNWLDQQRLLFAAAVIFGHSFELVGQVDPLQRVFGTASCGTLAVCGFFILSGYLISAAWDRAPQLAVYLRNRVLRIVPAFVVAFLLSVLVAGAVGARDPLAYYRDLDWWRLANDLATLGQPSARFPGAEHYQVNGAMWTIQIEFACYLLAPLLLASRWSLISAWAVCAALAMAHPSTDTALLISVPRFLLMFLSGALFWRLRLSADRWPLVLCSLVLPLALLWPATWALGTATAGAYLLLAGGLRASPLRLPDISYGVYLYGWPVQKLLVLAGLTTPWVLFPAALSISLMLGAASWFGVERYALRLKAGSHLQFGDQRVVLAGGRGFRAEEGLGDGRRRRFYGLGIMEAELGGELIGNGDGAENPHT